ncbi:TetR/AcrR family transcriptional regulator [Nocardioides marmoribigeumensis]|uniref:AcrR family transcriptional regulator n=1 Tax=Nocardioides marmoribigeumensis TaxID=433649 RepID=A0ABU2BVZ1_9ACTN|nr:TetR family transcriptional regulator [Nocardioides marmoribigeumensis]MDR7362441.1 AcrR family transcriptional regulator [Nocardioides marmoribigeumensis]
MTERVRRRGRRPAGEDTRATILEAAREEFALKGYAATSLRAVARRAGVDPALVHHYFDGKDDLFTATLDAPANPAALVGGILTESGSLEGVGERVVATFLGLWDDADAQDRLRGLLRNALEHEAALQAFREYLTADVLGRLGVLMPEAEAPLRTGLVGSQLIGLAVARYVVRLPGIADADPAALATAVGPTLQRYLSGPVH